MSRRRSAIFLGTALLVSAAAAACGSSGDASDPSRGSAPDPGTATAPPGTSPDVPSPGPSCTGDPTASSPKGPAQLANICARGYGDPVTAAFCGATAPTITSLADLQKVIGLDFKKAPPYAQGTTSGVGGNPGFILSAQSTSISTRKVSQINPRVILFTPPLARGRMTGTPKPNPSYVSLGFTRGEQAVELVAKNPTANGGKGDLRFFLLHYEQACNTAAGGCTNADLYTAAVESNFVGWSLYDEEDLKDTVLDCRQCHQPGGPGTPRMLRMQELQRPWQHWMYNDAIGITALRADFHAAHANEGYGGVPAGAADFGDVQQLEAFVENNGFIAQPHEFPGVTIAAELGAGGASNTWQSLYQGSETGQFIPVPYFDYRATDPTKVATLASQYSGVMKGTLPASALGDMSDVFDDAAERAMTHKPAAGLSGAQILVQICQECHNSHLDQAISRSHFNVENLAAISRAEKDEAIRRINLPSDACSHMPPQRFRELDAAEIGLVQAELAK